MELSGPAAGIDMLAFGAERAPEDEGEGPLSVDAVDVLQVITSASPRGAERYAVMLEPELARRGLKVRTVALHPGSNPALAVDILGQTRFGLETLRALRRACSGSAVVVAHGSATLPACAVATVGAGVPFVYRNIGDPNYWASSRQRRLRTRLFLARASDVIALTPEAGRRMTGCYGTRSERISVIPNGVPVEDFPPRSESDRTAARADLDIASGSRVAVYLGALSPEKDIATAIAAMNRLPERWTLLIGGDGPLRQEIAELAEAVPGSRVRLLGHVDNPLQVLQAADALVLTSLTEGLPGVIIEAAMVGVPAAVTDAGFVRDLVEDDVTGYVVPRSDPVALAEALLRMESKFEPMGSAAHSRSVREFSMAVTADQWFEVLNRHASQSAGRAGSKPGES